MNVLYWRTYIIPITSKNFPDDPHELLIFTRATLHDLLFCSLFLADEHIHKRMLKWIQNDGMLRVKRVQYIRS